MNIRKLENLFHALNCEKISISEKDKKEIVQDYSHDDTHFFLDLARMIFFPTKIEEIQQIVLICYKNNIPYLVRGAGTSRTGASSVVVPSVVISMERFQKIELYADDMMVYVEAGLTNAFVQNYLARYNLYYPVDPASMNESTIGGNIATNAGGMRAFKYGVTSDYVIALKVVLPTGEIEEFGATVRKNNTGYDLKRLFVGSEGTLGIIVGAYLKVLPYPTQRVLCVLGFSTLQKAIAFSQVVEQSHLFPSALEFIQAKAFEKVEKYMDESFVEPGVQTYLYIELESFGGDVRLELQELKKIIYWHSVAVVEIVEDEMKQKKYWERRQNISKATKKFSNNKLSIDATVPPSKIESFLQDVLMEENKFHIEVVYFGHLGDGNIHLNLLYHEDDGVFIWKKFEDYLTILVIEKLKRYQGTLTGEHGVGYLKQKYLSYFLSEKELYLHRSIKKLLDPKNLLNPNKIWEDQV